ncbi:MAG: circularly permuted type 2 ATP-grasp protein [Planctomycetota bacterium]
MSTDTTTDLHRYLPSTVWDEWFDASGVMRPGIQGVGSCFAAMSNESMNRLSREARRLVRGSEANFVLTRGVESLAARPWQLGVPPMIIDPEDWAKLSEGLVQRSRVLEATLRDLLGPQTLLRDRVIPADLLARCPAFHRPYHGLTSRNHLLVSATDLARDVSGNWWVTGDRTRAPSGLGFALENRILTTRLMPDDVDLSRVHRLASFFDRLRETLQDRLVSGDSGARLALLTPGPRSYRFIVDAYLARYLNMVLVQGDDLAVRQGQLQLKTLSGLTPIGSLWRHIDDADLDPLELDSYSGNGATGLLGVIREGHLSVANSPGSVLGEMPAIRSYLNQASRHFFGEDLILPSLQVHWLGDPAAATNVNSQQGGWIYTDAMRVSGDAPVDPATMAEPDRDLFLRKLHHQPHRFVATVRPERSTTAVWSDERGLHPAAMTLRTYQLQAADGFEVMPGGLTRVSDDPQRLDSSPRLGRFGLDTWVLAPEPVQHHVSRIPDVLEPVTLTRSGDELPSRVAESFFWLARTLERVDFNARLLRVTLRSLRDSEAEPIGQTLPRLVYCLANTGHLPPDYAIADLSERLPKIADYLPQSILDLTQPLGLARTVESLGPHAIAIRDRISIDAYSLIVQMIETLGADQWEPSETQADVPMIDIEEGVAKCTRLIEYGLAFSGLASDVMTRTGAWRFFELGRRVERGYQFAEFLRGMLVDAPEKSFDRELLEIVLRATDSIMTYRSRYLLRLSTTPVVDLLVCDATNPRSLIYQVKMIDDLVRQLPGRNRRVGLTTEERILQNLLHRLSMAQPASLCEISDGRHEALESLLKFVAKKLPKLSDTLTAHYLLHAQASRELSEGANDQRIDPTTGLD